MSADNPNPFRLIFLIADESPVLFTEEARGENDMILLKGVMDLDAELLSS
jgi:hypothetical protein